MSLNKYMKDNFFDLPIEKPLFYCGQQPQYSFGAIRFEIGSPDIEPTSKYCTYAYLRAKMIFEDIFSNTDNTYVVVNSIKQKNNKTYINDCQKYINKYTKNKINNFETLPYLYGYDINVEEDYVGFRYYLNCKVKDFNYNKLLKDICFTDEYEEVFFINTNKHVIYHLYDDRGADIVSNKVSTLEYIYKKYNKWILNYDRKLIDNIFKK